MVGHVDPHELLTAWPTKRPPKNGLTYRKPERMFTNRNRNFFSGLSAFGAVAVSVLLFFAVHASLNAPPPESTKWWWAATSDGGMNQKFAKKNQAEEFACSDRGTGRIFHETEGGWQDANCTDDIVESWEEDEEHYEDSEEFHGPKCSGIINDFSAEINGLDGHKAGYGKRAMALERQYNAECLEPGFCDDEDDCTRDFYSLITKQCMNSPLACDDDNPCTLGGCVEGKCVQTSLENGLTCNADGDYICIDGECVLNR